jgi:hypothetical protein
MSVRRRWVLAGAAAIVAILIGATILLESFKTLFPARSVDPLALAATFSPPELPNEIQGLPVLSVSEALDGRAAGRLEGGPHAVGGFWSSGLVGHSCAAPGAGVGTLQQGCHDLEFGITERDERFFVTDASGQVTLALGPSFTPWFPEQLPGLQALFTLPVINDQDFPPVPIVVVGHFDDPRAEDCQPAARQFCLDRLVVDAIAVFAVQAVPTPGPAPTATPFAHGEALFGPQDCGGDVPYSFVGWTTTKDLKLPFDRDGHVWAMVTAVPVDLGDPVGPPVWNDDPSGSGHQFRPFGRRICIAQQGAAGVMEFGSVPGSEFTLWDDGLRTQGLDR